MSDSGSSSINGETRMLERRVSNNRGDLTGDGQMNYFLAWFNTWSELQKSDFVPVLAGKMANATSGGTNGISDKMAGLNLASSSEPGRPPSLFSCQIKLFQDWFAGWSDDQKNYLVMRLKDIDGEFFDKYEGFVADPDKSSKEKDYFDPGVPEELIRHSNAPNAPKSLVERGKAIPEEPEEEPEQDEERKPAIKAFSEDDSEGVPAISETA